MSDRKIALHREAQTVVPLSNYGGTFRLKITALNNEMMPKEIFLHQRTLINHQGDEPVEEFVCVCSVQQLHQYPVYSANETSAMQFYRKAACDFRCPSVTRADELWYLIKGEVCRLKESLDKLDRVGYSQSWRCGGDIPEEPTSTSESASESASEIGSISGSMSEYPNTDSGPLETVAEDFVQERSITLDRFNSWSKFITNHGESVRLRVVPRDVYLMDSALFLFRKVIIDVSTGQEAEEFIGVCSTLDFGAYPVDEPNTLQEPALFRKSVLDVIVSSPDQATEAWEEICAQVCVLVNALNLADKLYNAETHTCDDTIPETSENESQSLSTSTDES